MRCSPVGLEHCTLYCRNGSVIASSREQATGSLIPRAGRRVRSEARLLARHIPGLADRHTCSARCAPNRSIHRSREPGKLHAANDVAQWDWTKHARVEAVVAVVAEHEDALLRHPEGLVGE